MKIDIFEKRNGDQRREIFCTVDDDQSVHYKISLFWNKHAGYLMKGDDCFVNAPDSTGFQMTTYGNMMNSMMFGGDNKPCLVHAKGPGSMRYNKGKLRQLADIHLNPESNVFKLVLDKAIKQYQDSGFKYEAA